MNVCMLTIGLFLGGALPAQTGGQSIPADADPQWVAGWQEEIEQQFQWLAAAYDLDASAQAVLWQELWGRVNDQFAYEQVMNAQLSDLAARIEAAAPSPDSPEDQAFSAEFTEMANRMPLAPDAVAAWVDGQVPAAVAAEGHQRYQEIRDRHSQWQEAGIDDATRLAGVNRGLMEGREAMPAPVTPNKKPLPQGPKGEKERSELQAAVDSAKVVQPNQVVAVEAPPAEPAEAVEPPEAVKPVETVKPVEVAPQPARTPRDSKADARPLPRTAGAQKPGAGGPPLGAGLQKPGAAGLQPPAKAAPLNEWDKYAIQVSEKYRFNEAQVTKAKAILANLRRRAYQYQVSRAADFSRVDLMTDAKVKQARLAELNRPMAALFEELKQRLEGLPTSEQRQQAESGKGKPAGKK